MRVLFALLCTVAVVSAGIACGDSECGPDSLIGTGKCCSAYGFCGSTSAYCGSGCTNGACTGRTLSGCQLTGQACPSGKCCSQYGYCGTTAAYCSRDPEFNCYSNCWSAAPKTSSSTKSTTSSTTSTTSTTSSTSSTSSTKASTVPSTSSAASTLVGCQLTGCGSSTEGKCCSQYGYCGNTAAHCSTSESCYSGCWSSVPAASRVYVGYWGDWTVQGNCPVTPESIPANNYTHINYAFASFNPSTGDLNSLDATLVNRLLALKTRNPSLKVLVSLGGGAAGDAPWTQLTSSATASARFYSTVLGWLNTYGFDGLDVDWEFPQEGEQSKVVAFFRQTRAALGTGKLLTTAGAAAWNVPQYVPGQWHQYVDFINVMNYDYFGSWSTTTGPISPINGATDSIEITMNAYINDGVPANKLVFGFANYGYTWAVASGTPQIGSAVVPDAGFAGACANSAGYIGATDIANLRRNPPAGFVERWDAAAQMPYATWGQQFATYENITSIKIKTDIVKQRGYLGGMLWVMDPNKEIDSYIWAQLKQ